MSDNERPAEEEAPVFGPAFAFDLERLARALHEQREREREALEAKSNELTRRYLTTPLFSARVRALTQLMRYSRGYETWEPSDSLEVMACLEYVNEQFLLNLQKGNT